MRCSAPLLSLPPLAACAIISLVTAVVLLLVIARMSDQARICARPSGAIQAALFEIRLLADDPLAVLRSFARCSVRTRDTWD